MKIEVSNGEIVDKVTILEIKKEKAEGEQLDHIVKELNYLQPIVDQLNVPEDLIIQLRKVNRRLWEIEDMLRVYEKESNFGRKFITFARAVYQTNHERFKLKSHINEITNSRLVEQKIHLGEN